MDDDFSVQCLQPNPAIQASVAALHGTSCLEPKANLANLGDDSCDAAVMVNALYAVDDPLACLQEVHRILKKNGVFGLSTTHSDTKLDPLLKNIKSWLTGTPRYAELSGDFEVVHDVNKQIEIAIARRHTRDEYREWLQASILPRMFPVPMGMRLC